MAKYTLSIQMCVVYNRTYSMCVSGVAKIADWKTTGSLSSWFKLCVVCHGVDVIDSVATVEQFPLWSNSHCGAIPTVYTENL